MNITAVYGPDGAGKTTYLASRAESAPHVFNLHGTKLENWPEALEPIGIKLELPPEPEDVIHRSLYAAEVIRKITAKAPDVVVAIDGLCIHKTLASKSIEGISIHEMVAQLNIRDVMGGIGHIAINNQGPESSDTQYAVELQRRIHTRGTPSKWDPVTVEASLQQVQAYRKLEEWIKGNTLNIKVH